MTTDLMPYACFLDLKFFLFSSFSKTSAGILPPTHFGFDDQTPP